MDTEAPGYRRIRRLGTGSAATVWLVRSRDSGREYALKIFHRTAESPVAEADTDDGDTHDDAAHDDAAHDRVGHDRLHLLRHYADIGLVAAVVGKTIEAEPIVEMAEQPDVFLQRDVGAPSTATAAAAATTATAETTATAAWKTTLTWYWQGKAATVALDMKATGHIVVWIWLWAKIRSGVVQR